MYISFNELSFKPLPANDHILLDCFSKLTETFTKTQQQYGLSHILFPSDIATFQVTETKKMVEWLESLSTKDKNKIFPLIYKKPFLNDSLDDKEQGLYCYYFHNEELKIEQEYCLGLATAHLLEIPSISLVNHSVWIKNKIEICKEDSETQTIEVVNISTLESIESETFQSFADIIAEVELMPTTLSYSEKKIHFRDDHGIDILKRFAEKILQSEYVEGVINSLPFNSKTSRFVRNVSKEGLIEIILHWEDAGYGMVIKSTGRNYRETKAISEILKNKFDR